VGELDFLGCGIFDSRWSFHPREPNVSFDNKRWC
jgi:hypothetical protein